MSLFLYVVKVLLVGGFYSTCLAVGVYMLLDYMNDYPTGDNE